MSLIFNRLANSFNAKSICFVLIAFLDFLFQFNPVTSSFSYEYSALNALLLFLFCGVFTIRKDLNVSQLLLREHFSFYLVVFLLPIFISLTSNLFLGGCPVSSGFKFYFLIVLPAQILAISLAVFINSVLFQKAWRYLAFFFVFSLFIFENLFEFYFLPQVYFFNQIILFFPGTLYDDLILLNKLWLFFRFFTLVFSFLLLFLSVSKIKRIVKISVPFFLYFAFFLLKPTLGFSTDLNSICALSPTQLKTKHFEILVTKKISRKEAKYLKADFEFNFGELKNYLKVQPSEKIVAVIFKDRFQKLQIFGSKNADIAKIWLSQIFLDYTNYDRNLKHELAHIFSAKFGSTIFKLPADFNVGLLEGFATAVANNFDDFNVHYPVKLFGKDSLTRSLEAIFSNVNFFGLNSSFAYSYAGSFLRFLADNYGVTKLEKVYSIGDFKQVYGKNFSQLAREYQEYLKTLPSVENPFRNQLYFASKPLIKKYCVRAIAEEREQARQLLLQNKITHAEKLFEKIYAQVPTPRDLVTLVELKIQLKKYAEAQKLLDKDLPQFTTTSYYFALILLKARVNNLLKNNEIADSLCAQLIRMNPHPYYTNFAVALREIFKKYPDFYLLSTKEKKRILLSLIFAEKNAIYAPMLLGLINTNYSEFSDFILTFAERINKNKLRNLNSYLLLQITREAEKKLFLEQAKLLISKAISLNTDYFRQDVLSEELKKIRFIEQFLRNEDEEG